jgi:hypothetical protein
LPAWSVSPVRRPRASYAVVAKVPSGKFVRMRRFRSSYTYVVVWPLASVTVFWLPLAS